VRTEIFTLPEASVAEPTKNRAGRLVLRAAAGAAAVAVLVVGLAGTATAEETPPESTIANVGVGSSIALTGLTESFLLTGVPGATVTGVGAVAYTVLTNNLAGYSVTVQSQTATLAPTAVGNTDSIPIGALSARDSTATAFTAVNAVGTAATATVHTQDERSAELGDALTTDFRVVIPFVNTDTYSATLDYVATTL
jgi:hypothetical protein